MSATRINKEIELEYQKSTDHSGVNITNLNYSRGNHSNQIRNDTVKKGNCTIFTFSWIETIHI